MLAMNDYNDVHGREIYSVPFYGEHSVIDVHHALAYVRWRFRHGCVAFQSHDWQYCSVDRSRYYFLNTSCYPGSNRCRCKDGTPFHSTEDSPLNFSYGYS